MKLAKKIIDNMFTLSVLIFVIVVYFEFKSSKEERILIMKTLVKEIEVRRDFNDLQSKFNAEVVKGFEKQLN